jgi:hypothetical protein
MGQTSTERLMDYLAQLSPQSQALLMREFERAIERGEDTSIANFVLEQLRRIVRANDEGARPRSDNPARLLFRPLEPFLVDGNVPLRPGQIRRESLLPVWRWLQREGAPDLAGEFELTLSKGPETGSSPQIEAAVRQLQAAAADAILKIATTAPGTDQRRALSRLGPPDMVEDLLSIAWLLLPATIQRSANRLGKRGTQCSHLADAAAVAVRAVIGDAAAGRTMANHPTGGSDGRIR